MRFNIITNLANGVGLQRDYEILRQALTARGHQVTGFQFNAPCVVAPTADVAVFLEVITPAFLYCAPRLWAVPNPEWWLSGWDQFLPRFERILAKTRDCERIFAHKCAVAPSTVDRRPSTVFTGWRARDLYHPAIPRERKFLHLAGKSQFKNTAAVIEGCRRAGVELTVIGQHVPADVPHQHRVTDAELVEALNRHQFHLLPSAYEGYGHALHEGLGVGAVIITTDAPPMNQLGAAWHLPATNSRVHHAAPLYSVTPEAVANAVRVLMDLGDLEIEKSSRLARERFLQDDAEFDRALDALLNE